MLFSFIFFHINDLSTLLLKQVHPPNAALVAPFYPLPLMAAHLFAPAHHDSQHRTSILPLASTRLGIVVIVY